MDSASRQRPPEWYLSWMVGPAQTQIDNRKEACGELIAALTSSSTDSSFDADTLRDLIDILNHEFMCLRLGSALNPDDFPTVFSRAWADRLLTVLSDCLVKSISPTAYLERELQCRALLTTIALLSALGATALHNGFYDSFYSALQKRFEDLQWQAGSTGDLTYAKFCKVQCSYLLSAAKEFASRFQKAEPLVVTASSRILNLLSFAGSAAPATGGAINLQSASRQLAEALKDVSHKPEKRYQALFSLHELTITIEALHLYEKMCSAASYDSDLISEASRRLDRLVSLTLQNILSILIEQDKWERDKYESRVYPPAEFWQKYVLTTLKRGPPSFNLYYYLYGVVDCAAQIAKVVDKTILPSDLSVRLKRAALSGDEATHRWKALEYLVSAEPNPAQLQRTLLADAPSSVKKRFGNELSYISNAVSGDIAHYPLPLLLSSPDEKPHKKAIHPSSYIESEIPLTSITPYCHDISLQSNVLPAKHVLSAGLSPDCNAAFFLTKESVVAVSLAKMRDSGAADVLATHYKDKLELRQSAISNHYLATITSQELIVTAYNHSPEDTEGTLIGRLRLGKASDGSMWVPRYLDIHDTHKRTWIVIAGETTLKGVTCGMIEVYQVFAGPSNYLLSRHDNSLVLASREVLKGDLIKSIAFSPSGGKLACVTNSNRVVLWQLTNNLRPRSDPFILRHKSTIEPDVRGLTSATVFHSPSGKHYLLGTTWPSSERVKNGGEWSFISPVASAPAEVPRKLFHKLQDLGDAGPFIAGAASPNGELIALLERSGNIFLVPLAKNDDGGVRSWDVIKLEQQKNLMLRQDETIPSSLRFCLTQEGLELFVLKRNGTLVHKSFEGIQGATIRRSPRPSLLTGASEDSLSVKNSSLLRPNSRDDSEAMETLSLRLESSNVSRMDTHSVYTPEERQVELKAPEAIIRCEVLGKADTLAIVSEFPRSFGGDTSSISSSMRKSSAEQSDSQLSSTDSTGSTPSISFHRHLADLQVLEREMLEYTELLHLLRKDDSSGCWTTLSPKTPSIEGIMSSLQDTYEWVAYLHDTNRRALDGLLALQEMNIIDDTITILVTDNSRAQVVRVLPVAISTVETMNSSILQSVQVLQPHMDDPREADWGTMFDALSPLKKIWNRTSASLELDLPLDQDTDIPSPEQLEGLLVINKMILVGLISYTRSHTSSFLQTYLEERCEELRLETSGWTMGFRKTTIHCLEPLIQGPVWVFKMKLKPRKGSAAPPNMNQKEEDNTDSEIFLSTTILDFADLWGPARLVHQSAEDEITSEIDWPGGTLRAQVGNYANQPRTINDEIRCYGIPWTKVGSAEDMGPVKPFDCTKRLLIS